MTHYTDTFAEGAVSLHGLRRVRLALVLMCIDCERGWGGFGLGAINLTIPLTR